MAVKLSPVFQDAQLDSNGNPYSGAKLFTYAAGSTTKQTVYQDSNGSSAHTNPIILNSRGEPPAPIWLTKGSIYKFVLTTPTDSDPPVNAIRTIDNVSGINDTTVSLDQWIASGLTPTYVSATSFTLAGDQTTAFHVGRKLKSINSGGTIYSRITVAAYAAGTSTITVENDSGTLDSGLSAVSYGIVTRANTSQPAMQDDQLVVVDPVDPTKRLRIDVGNVTAGQTRVVNAADFDTNLGINSDTEDTTPNLGADYLQSYDDSAGVHKKVLLGRLNGVLGTSQPTTSGTAFDFTGIPSWAKQIAITFNGVSLSGTDDILVQTGDAGGIETSGYTSTSCRLPNAGAIVGVSSTAGFIIGMGANGQTLSGTMLLTLADAANTWVASMSGKVNTTNAVITGGDKATSATLDRVRITRSGTDTFDAGAVNISYR